MTKPIVRPPDWKQKSKDKVAYGKAWRKEHPGYKEKWLKANPDQMEKDKARRRARYERKQRLIHGEGWVRGVPGGGWNKLSDEERIARKRARKRKQYYKIKAEHPERMQAKFAVKNAVKSGALVSIPCWVCSEVETEGHHPDYSEPLQVVWLCREHHREVHKMAMELLQVKSAKPTV